MTITTSILMLMVAAIMAGAAMVLSFIRGWVAVLAAYAAMVVAHLSHVAMFSSNDLVFWGVAAVIAAAGEYYAPARPPRSLCRYGAGGAMAGSVIGLAMGSQAAVIVAGAIAIVMAAMAWKRTPAGRKFRSRLSPLLLATIGLCPLVNFTIIMLILAQIISTR